MKILNRSAITVTYKKPFVDWHNALMPDMPLPDNMIGESSTYLVSELFDVADKLLRKHYNEFLKMSYFRCGQMKTTGHKR